MSTETIARRYATALADAVIGTGETETVRHDLEQCTRLFEGSDDLQNVFTNPAITHANKEKVLEGLLAKVRPAKAVSNFLKVLLQNGRLAELSEISDRFEAVLSERSGVVSAEITSARELPADERAEFEKNLERITGKKVNIAFAIDKDIIGGVVTRIGSTVFDGSVKTKLENLKEQLVNG
jgi:F-type H+-transporting ATPase subunit delta